MLCRGFDRRAPLPLGLHQGIPEVLARCGLTPFESQGVRRESISTAEQGRVPHVELFQATGHPGTSPLTSLVITLDTYYMCNGAASGST